MYLGLALYGLAIALEVRARLGLDPWDVFHQGLAKLLGISIGTCVILVGGVVLLVWIPLHERPGIGTISNVIVIGLGIDVALRYLPVPIGIPLRIATLVGGIVLCGIATGAYIGAGFGPGPRDGLMMGIARRGHSIRVSRTVIEVSVLVVGFLLGGRVGLGTVLFAVSIGPIAHVTIPFFRRTAST
ncbi:MAG: YczE/YyaS/YitT family protein [Actinomycetota bacterium]